MANSIRDIQKKILELYGVVDDRLYTVEDLLYYGQKFTLDFLRKLEVGEKRAEEDLVVAAAWFLALMNRYHLNLEPLVWKRYSYKCPFCLNLPCTCLQKEGLPSKKTGRPSSGKPHTLDEWQKMLSKIYPDENISHLSLLLLRRLDDLNYSFRLFLREKEKKHFREIEIKSADYFVLILRVCNALDYNFGQKFTSMFKNYCYVCHQKDCQCNYF